MLINASTRILCQGITSAFATVQVERALAYGAQVVAGTVLHVSKKSHLHIPLFDTVANAIDTVGAIDASIVYTPAPSVMDAVVEAVTAGIKLIVCIAEGVPLMDMMRLRRFCQQKRAILIGPNCLGIIVPNQSVMGVMPTELFHPGAVGIISRAGSLTYEVVMQLNAYNIGQSACVGIGGDVIVGSTFTHMLPYFENDPATKLIVLVGEVGGAEEERAARYITHHVSKPVVAYIVGARGSKNRSMGHAGAIIAAGLGTIESKREALLQAGVQMVDDLLAVGETVHRYLPADELVDN